jgi:diaminopimelate epimerase
MRIFNAAGSEGLMCGNASRCIGKYVYERGLTDKRHIRLLTASGIKMLDLMVNDDGTVESVTVDMLAPVMEDEHLFLPSGEALPEGVFVSIGNPHYVIFVDDINAVDVAREGAILERHSRFPERCNIEFAQVREDGIRVRVWERGSGITMACGTGSWEFFDYLLNELQIVGTPGEGFGACGEGYLRFSTFGSREDTVEAARRLAELLER